MHNVGVLPATDGGLLRRRRGKGGRFAPRGRARNHQHDSAAQLSGVLSREMMGRGRSNPGSTGGEITWDILEQYAEDHPGVDAALIPSIESLRRKANRTR